jgi:hypothetical protein
VSRSNSSCFDRTPALAGGARHSPIDVFEGGSHHPPALSSGVSEVSKSHPVLRNLGRPWQTALLAEDAASIGKKTGQIWNSTLLTTTAGGLRGYGIRVCLISNVNFNRFCRTTLLNPKSELLCATPETAPELRKNSYSEGFVFRDTAATNRGLYHFKEVIRAPTSQSDCRSVARVDWCRDRNLSGRPSRGRASVDCKRLALEDVIKPLHR